MSTKRHTRRSLWFFAFLAVTLYVMISVGIAVSTADRCDGHLDGQKSWSYLPPHWQCPSRFGS